MNTMSTNCGICNGKVLNDRSDHGSTRGYHKKCECCDIVYALKSRCAQHLYQKSVQSINTALSNASPIDSTTFNATTIKLYCINCEQKCCFYCNKLHNGTLLYVIIIT